MAAEAGDPEACTPGAGGRGPGAGSPEPGAFVVDARDGRVSRVMGRVTGRAMGRVGLYVRLPR